MKKLKVYLDTSVISYLDQPDAAEKMADTVALWKLFKADIYPPSVLIGGESDG